MNIKWILEITLHYENAQYKHFANYSEAVLCGILIELPLLKFFFSRKGLQNLGPDRKTVGLKKA